MNMAFIHLQAYSSQKIEISNFIIFSFKKAREKIQMAVDERKREKSVK
jgi:hypothetical protein